MVISLWPYCAEGPVLGVIDPLSAVVAAGGPFVEVNFAPHVAGLVCQGRGIVTAGN